MMKRNILILLTLTILLVVGCSLAPQAAKAPAGTANKSEAVPASDSLSGAAAEIAEARGLSPDDISAALKTYMPTGKHDDYFIFASGGQSGQVLVIGVPSMRLLKVIGVFTPEPWQGWGYGGDSDKIIAQGKQAGHTITWGDMHHPNLSETNGD